MQSEPYDMRPKRNSDVFIAMDEDEWEDFSKPAEEDPVDYAPQMVVREHRDNELDENVQQQPQSISSHRMGVSLAHFNPAEMKKYEQTQQKDHDEAVTKVQQIGVTEVVAPLATSPAKDNKVKNPGQKLLNEILKKHNLNLLEQLEGEVFVNISQPMLYCENRVCKGKFLLTNYRFAFYSEGYKKKLDIALGFIERVGLRQEKKNGVIIEIYLKYSPIWKFKYDRKEDGELVDSLLNLYCFPLKIDDFFAFSHHKFYVQEDQETGGAKNYEWACNLDKEYERIGLTKVPKLRAVQNSTLKICETYPSIIYVPTEASDDLLRKVARNRERERLPVATYMVKNSGISHVLYRGSQIRAGVDKLLTDVQYLNHLSYDSKLVILETRTRMNTRIVELPQYYKNCELEFLGIDPPASVKAAYFKLVEACIDSDACRFIKSVVESKWYDQVKELLCAALKVVKLLDDRRNVFIHCSDGWDRTSQISALTQIIIDPYYRTFQGFPILIEKEFVSFGDPFHLRLGHKGRSEEQIPIFIQFLDCVSQLITQFPLSFQFTNKYIGSLSHLMYTNRFGTFIASCEAEIKNFGIRQKTLSVWPELRDQALNINPYYLNPKQTGIIELGGLNTSEQALKFWKEHFYRLTGTVKDSYKLSPYAEDNQDYLNLAHLKLKGQTKKLKKLVTEQMEQIQTYKEELRQLDKEQQLTMAVVKEIVQLEQHLG